MVCFNCCCWWSAAATAAADDNDDGDDDDGDDYEADDEDAAADNLLVRLWGRLAATTAASPATPAGLSLGLWLLRNLEKYIIVFLSNAEENAIFREVFLSVVYGLFLTAQQ